MDNNQNNIVEARLRKTVRKAFKRLLKNIESEPVLVVESGDTQADAPEETEAEIRAFLFKRR